MKCLSMIAAVAACAAGCGGDDGSSIDDPIVTTDAGAGNEPDAASPPDARDRTPDAPPQKEWEGVSMELGIGNREFTTVKSDTTVYLFKGPQGGYMVYLSVRAIGINTNDAMFCYEEHVVDTDREVGKKCWHIK